MIVVVALCYQLLMLQLIVAKDCNGSTTKANEVCYQLLISQLVVANDCFCYTMFSVVNEMCIRDRNTGVSGESTQKDLQGENNKLADLCRHRRE